MTSKKLILTIALIVLGHFCFGQSNTGGRWSGQTQQPQQSRPATSSQQSRPATSSQQSRPPTTSQNRPPTTSQNRPPTTSQNRPATTQSVNESVTLPSLSIPSLSIKSNLLYDATTSMNLGLELRTGDNTSFEIPVTYNPWTFTDNKKWRHILVQPEFRYWTDETFAGHFFGLHGHYAFYNVGKLDAPPFSEYMNTHRFQGWLAGAGLSYGYRWNFDHHWGLEATIGVGYAHLSYDKYACDGCSQGIDKWIGGETKNYFGPTKAGISLIYTIGGNKTPKQSKYKQVYPVERGPTLTVSFIRPAVEEVKERSSEVGKAYLEFIVDRSEIAPNFRNNDVELRRIQELIRQVASDPNAIITNISITGFASPEGTSDYNMELSQRRAISFKDYIKNFYSLRENLFTARGAGEDWATLEKLVSRSSLTDKNLVLEIIRSPESLDSREKRLMELSGGRAYRQIFSEMYPELRRMECQVHYTVVPFTVEKGKEIYRTKPNNLSLNEMFLIAQSYPPGSAEYKEVFVTAARLFPQSDVANINAAAIALSRKDLNAATGYLAKVKVQNTAYWNNYGVLSWYQGDRRKAIDCFVKGGKTGKKNLSAVGK